MQAAQQSKVPIDLSSLPDIGDEIVSKQLTRWVFSAGEAINISDRHCGIPVIERARLTPLKSFQYRGRIETAEVLMDEDIDPVQIVNRLRQAWESALEVERAYAPIGLVVLENLTGAKDEFVHDLEDFIYGGEVPETLVQLQNKLYEAKTRQLTVEVSPAFRQVLDGVIDAMLRSADTAMAHQLQEVDLAETEVERRGLPGGVGRAGYTAKDLQYFKQLERTPKTRVMEDLAEQQRMALKVVQQAALQGTQVVQPQETAFNNGRVPCPVCAEPIMPTAKKCIHCGEYLTEAPVNKPQKAKSAK